MNDYKTLTIDNQDFKYDLDPDLVFNFTPDHIKFVYTKRTNSVAVIKTILNRQLDSRERLRIQSVLCCRSSTKEPILVIIATNTELIDRIFCYSVSDQQLVQVSAENTIKHDITQSSITKDPFDVVFMDKISSEVASCYALVIGTSDGNTALLLLNIIESNFEAQILTTELFKGKNNGDLGHATAIHILPPDKTDRRMGHSDPQILLGYSKGAILIYRFRANIYVPTATRLRTPVILSEFAEFPDYPITRLSCVRSYNSLAMTVAFAQEKPLSNLKYQYSSSYVKLVETHGDSSQISKKIIIPSTNSEWRIMEAKLLVSTPATKELESMIQLSVIFECEDKFNLSMWHISPKSFQQQIDLELEKRTYIDMMEYRFKSNPDDVLGFCKHNPQKLVQNMLEHLKDPYIQDTGSKRKHDDEEPQEGVEKKEEKIVKKKKVMTEPFVESHSDDEILEAAGKKQQNDSGEDEIYATEDAITMIKDVESDEQNEQLYAENSLPVEEDKSSGLANKSELSSDSSGLEGSTVAVESVVKESVMETIEKAVETDYSIEGIIEQSESSMEAIEEAMESCFETIEETSETVETKESNVEATIQENFLQEVKIVENTSKEPLQQLSPAAELLREIPSEKSSIQVVEEPANSIQDNPVEYLVDDLVEAMVDESAETVVENLFGSVEEKLASQGTEEATHLVEEPDQPPTEQPISLEDNTIANNEASLTEIKANFDETTGSEASISNHHLEENPDTVNNANEKTKELAEDYVFVDLEDIPENATGSFNDAQASNTIQQDYISQNVPLNEQDSNDEYAFASIPDKFERLDDSQADQESLLDAPNDEDLDQNFITDAANDEEPDEEPDKEGNDEEMDYGQDYGEDEVVYNPPNEQSNEAYVLLSSEEERGIQEVDESDTEAEENSEEQDTSMFDSIVGEKEENDLIEDEYEEEEPSSTIKDDLSDIGSIQQFFVPASNASYDDSTPKETSDKDTTQSAPSVDYIPVMEQDLFRLLREADIPAISNNTDITTNQNLDYANIYSSNITEDGGNKNNFYTFLPKQEPEQEPEMTKEDEELRKMQEKKLESENKFSALLEEIVGNKDIDSFMKQPLILEEQMDKLGSACWFSTDPRLKFLLIQYCDKHELGDQVVSLCRLLSNTSMFSSFFEEEESEFKRIYRKYLKDYTADSKVINVFTKEGRDRSLQDEANYSKSNTFTCYNNKDQKKIHHSYMQYYGFGFFKKF